MTVNRTVTRRRFLQAVSRGAAVLAGTSLIRAAELPDPEDDCVLKQAMHRAGNCCLAWLDPEHDYMPTGGYEVAHDTGRWWDAMLAPRGRHRFRHSGRTGSGHAAEHPASDGQPGRSPDERSRCGISQGPCNHQPSQLPRRPAGPGGTGPFSQERVGCRNRPPASGHYGSLLPAGRSIRLHAAGLLGPGPFVHRPVSCATAGGALVRRNREQRSSPRGHSVFPRCDRRPAGDQGCPAYRPPSSGELGPCRRLRPYRDRGSEQRRAQSLLPRDAAWPVPVRVVGRAARVRRRGARHLPPFALDAPCLAVRLDATRLGKDPVSGRSRRPGRRTREL